MTWSNKIKESLIYVPTFFRSEQIKSCFILTIFFKIFNKHTPRTSTAPQNNNRIRFGVYLLRNC